MNEKQELKIPHKSCYGTICNKLLQEFMEHHEISDMPLPGAGDTAGVALEKIFRILVLTIPEEKRKSMIKDANAYYHDLPPHVR